MIFVTVGAQMAFPRLIDAVDRWAEAAGREDVFAQIGPADANPNHIEWTRFVAPIRFREIMSECDLVVGHAGMGTIIGALVAEKPLVIMPRRGDLMETRNDHQVATAARLAADRNVSVAHDEEQLFATLNRADMLAAPRGATAVASDGLLAAIHGFTYGKQDVQIVTRKFDVGQRPVRSHLSSVVVND